jgi:hypothetical protein
MGWENCIYNYKWIFMNYSCLPGNQVVPAADGNRKTAFG